MFYLNKSALEGLIGVVASTERYRGPIFICTNFKISSKLVKNWLRIQRKAFSTCASVFQGLSLREGGEGGGKRVGRTHSSALSVLTDLFTRSQH